MRGLRPAFEHGVAIGRIDPRLLEYDLDRLAAALDPSADLDFDFLGLQTLYDRYLAPYRAGTAPLRMLEIGVSKGGSLWLWRRVFGERLTLFGIDIDQFIKHI